MSFRDDREAAHRRAEALEQELARAQREVATLRSGGGRSRAPWVIGGALVAVAAGGAGAGLWASQQSAAREQEAAAARQAEAVRRTEAERVAAARALAARHAEERAAEEAARAERERRAAAAAAAQVPAASVTWSGSV